MVTSYFQMEKLKFKDVKGTVTVDKRQSQNLNPALSDCSIHVLKTLGVLNA